MQVLDEPARGGSAAAYKQTRALETTLEPECYHALKF